MSNNDSSLFGFLKKKSVFSPSKVNRKRSRSKSRDSRNFDQRSNQPTVIEDRREEPVKGNPIFQGYNPTVSDNLQRNFNNYQANNVPANNNYPMNNNPPNMNNYPVGNNAPLANNYPANNNYQGNNIPSNNYQGNNIPNNNFNLNNNVRPQFQTPIHLNQDAEDNLSQMSQNSVWTGILSHSTSFESARVESSQCLDNLSLKIRKEISNINSKIDIFNSRMTSVLNNEFRSIREKVMQVFEAAFKESDKYIQEYMKQKEAQLAGELVKMKATLEKELTKIDTMKDELGKPQWRKVAGEILSTELEHQVEEVVQRSNAMEVGKWQLGDITGYRIKNIEAQLKEVIRLKA